MERARVAVVDPVVAARLVQLFVYHDGERVHLVTAPAGAGKTAAVRAWLDAAGSAVAQIWLTPPAPGSLDNLDVTDVRPAFVVVDDCELTPDLVTAALTFIARTPPRVVLVLITTDGVPDSLAVEARTGRVRITTEHDLAAARAAPIETSVRAR